MAESESQSADGGRARGLLDQVKIWWASGLTTLAILYYSLDWLAAQAAIIAEWYPQFSDSQGHHLPDIEATYHWLLSQMEALYFLLVLGTPVEDRVAAAVAILDRCRPDWAHWTASTYQSWLYEKDGLGYSGALETALSHHCHLKAGYLADLLGVPQTYKQLGRIWEERRRVLAGLDPEHQCPSRERRFGPSWALAITARQPAGNPTVGR